MPKIEYTLRLCPSCKTKDNRQAPIYYRHVICGVPEWNQPRYVRCGNPACMKRTIAHLTEEQAINDWNR